MTELTSFDPSKEGLQDLDDIVNAKKLVDILNASALAREFTLDLKNCYVDYGPCSSIMENLVERLSAMDGKKTISIDTILDLGKPEHYCNLLFRSASRITKGEPDYTKLRLNVSKALASANISISVRIFSSDRTDENTPLRIVDPLSE